MEGGELYRHFFCWWRNGIWKLMLDDGQWYSEDNTDLGNCINKPLRLLEIWSHCEWNTFILSIGLLPCFEDGFSIWRHLQVYLLSLALISMFFYWIRRMRNHFAGKFVLNLVRNLECEWWLFSWMSHRNNNPSNLDKMHSLTYFSTLT